MFLGPLAMSSKAIAVIISPLNGLMEQQVCYSVNTCWLFWYFHYQVKILTDASVSAVHVTGCSMFDAVCKGEYRFG